MFGLSKSTTPDASDGFKTTFDVLAKTKNEAAVATLLAALDSPHRWISDQALRTILRRRSPAGQRAILSRLHNIDERWQEILAENSGRMTSTLRDAILGSDMQLCQNACHAATLFGEYDLMATLLTAAEDRNNPHADQAAATLVDLAEQLYEELAAPRDYRRRRDPQLVRAHVVTSLEHSVKRYSNHKRREAIEAFLLLATRDNATLKRILQNPLDPTYLAIVDTLTHSLRQGVMRLLLNSLDDPRAPSSVIAVLTHRSDPTFLTHLLHKIGQDPSRIARQNIKRMEAIVWLRDDLAVLDNLDDAAQQAAVRLVTLSSMKRLDVFPILAYLLKHGRPGGRRAAIEALVDFNGVEANALVIAALDDDDSQVRASALAQLRKRGMPGAMSRLVAALDSHDDVVRNAARGALREFQFDRYFTSYESMDDESRSYSAKMVRKVDPTTVARLVKELQSPARSRRLRAVEIIVLMSLVDELAHVLIGTLEDEDHIVRVAAVRALAACGRPEVRKAIAQRQKDRSVAVQEAVQESLGQQGRELAT